MTKKICGSVAVVRAREEKVYEGINPREGADIFQQYMLLGESAHEARSAFFYQYLNYDFILEIRPLPRIAVGLERRKRTVRGDALSWCSALNDLDLRSIFGFCYLTTVLGRVPADLAAARSSGDIHR